MYGYTAFAINIIPPAEVRHFRVPESVPIIIMYRYIETAVLVLLEYDNSHNVFLFLSTCNGKPTVYVRTSG